MIYLPVLATTLFCALLVPLGCSKAPIQQRQGASVSSITNDRSAGTDTGDVLRAKNAELEVQQKNALVQSDFMKMRESYRKQITASLTALDRKVTILEGKAKYSEGKARNNLEMGLTQIRADRYAFTDDYKSLDTVTSANWDATKARLDKQWTELSNLVDRS
jgi:hypothetical protein